MKNKIIFLAFVAGILIFLSGGFAMGEAISKDGIIGRGDKTILTASEQKFIDFCNKYRGKSDCPIPETFPSRFYFDKSTYMSWYNKYPNQPVTLDVRGHNLIKIDYEVLWDGRDGVMCEFGVLLTFWKTNDEMYFCGVGGDLFGPL